MTRIATGLELKGYQNALLTATYWLVGKRIVIYEQKGKARARYGKALLKRLSEDLKTKFGWQQKSQTMSAKLEDRTQLLELAKYSPLPWSHYVKLITVKSPQARAFYEVEALRGGWTVRQLDRQISTQLYERILLSKKKASMLEKGSAPESKDALQPEDEIKDPYVLGFLGLKDEYSESDLEEALIGKLEAFLLELGGDFTFMGRQRRLRIGDDWYRVDLLFYHRRLRCLIVVDLKLGKFTHADAGQMHMYLNYARKNWMLPNENPPVGIILCAHENDTVAHYALEGLPRKVLTAEYRTTFAEEKALVEELKKTRIYLDKWKKRNER